MAFKNDGFFYSCWEAVSKAGFHSGCCATHLLTLFRSTLLHSGPAILNSYSFGEKLFLKLKNSPLGFLICFRCYFWIDNLTRLDYSIKYGINRTKNKIRSGDDESKKPLNAPRVVYINDNMNLKECNVTFYFLFGLRYKPGYEISNRENINAIKCIVVIR